MKNLKILSMNLGRGFVPIKDKRKREYLMEFIKEENYDVVMLQGTNICHNLDLNRFLGYYEIQRCYNFQERVVTLYKLWEGQTSYGKSDVMGHVFYNKKGPLACINVNCKDSKNFDDVFNICDHYSRQDSKGFVRNRIVAGRFPREVDINEFCDRFDLTDVSTSVGQESHIKNNREMLNHFFISRNLEIDSVHKLVGMTEESKIGEAYPIEASISYKKVLK